MAKVMLADLSEGMSVNTLAYLKQMRLMPFKNKAGNYLRVLLADRSGTLGGKLWEGADEVASNLAEGTVVNVTGRVEKFGDTLEIKLDNLTPWTGATDPTDFLPAYAGDVDALAQKLDALLASFTNPELAGLLQAIFTDPEIRRKFCEAPAARGVHGAYLHGLLEHVVCQADLAEAACACYPRADRDLVLAGVLLHDVGKIEEFAWDGAGIEYSDIGSLHGHIIIGDRLVYEWARALGVDDELTTRLRHLILSHHGVPEFGAPVVPKTLEAVILHAVDNLEAKATHCIEMLTSGNPDAAWTEWDRIEGRTWYRGHAAETV
jgi:3'-5' exoribonuclease